MTIKAHKIQSNITKSSSMTLAELAVLLTTDVVDLKFKSTALGNGNNPDEPPFDSTSHITL